MSEPTTTTMAVIHDAILMAVSKHWAGKDNQLDTVAEYDPFDQKPVNSPAVLLSIENMAISERDNTGRTGVILDCNLTCILSTRTPNVQVQIRQFAAELIRLVEQEGMSRWGLGNCCNIAGNINGQPALYSPEKSGFESFAVTWSQVFYIGGPDSPVQPLPDTVFASKTPEIGIPYEPDYEQLVPVPPAPDPAPIPDFQMPLIDSLEVTRGTAVPVFSRSSPATYIDKDTGVLTTAAVNEPRFEAEGLLMEGKSTNYVLRSSTRGYSDSSESSILLPDGVHPAFLKTDVLGAAGERGSVYVTIPIAAGDTLTSAVYALIPEGEVLVFALSRGEGTPYEGSDKYVTGTGSWQRVEVSHTFEHSWDRAKLTITNKEGVTCNEFYQGLFQLEKLPFATSYIETEDLPVAREADVLQIPSSIFGDFNQPNTFSVEIDWRADPSKQTRALHLSGSPTYYHWYYSVSGQAANLMETRWGAPEYPAAVTGFINSGLIRGTTVYNGTTLKQYNNSEIKLDVPYISNVNLIDEYIKLGDRNFFGHFRGLDFWNRALTEDEESSISNSNN